MTYYEQRLYCGLYNREGAYADCYWFDPHVWHYTVWCLFGAYLLTGSAYTYSHIQQAMHIRHVQTHDRYKGLTVVAHNCIQHS